VNVTVRYSFIQTKTQPGVEVLFTGEWGEVKKHYGELLELYSSNSCEKIKKDKPCSLVPFEKPSHVNSEALLDKTIDDTVGLLGSEQKAPNEAVSKRQETINRKLALGCEIAFMAEQTCRIIPEFNQYIGHDNQFDLVSYLTFIKIRPDIGMQNEKALKQTQAQVEQQLVNWLASGKEAESAYWKWAKAVFNAKTTDELDFAHRNNWGAKLEERVDLADYCKVLHGQKKDILASLDLIELTDNV
jgi:hypothetical protein